MTEVNQSKFGVVGLGRMGSRLIEATRNLGGEVTAALDMQDLPFAVEKDDSLRSVFTSDPEVFWKTPMDALLVSTTGPSHMPLLREALSHGIKHIVIEKPMCVGVADGKQALRLADEVGARVIVNHGRRYCPNFERLEKMIGGPELGDLRGMTITLGAAGLGCMGVHYLDLFIRLLGGMPESVRAIGGQDMPINPRGAHFNDPGSAAFMTWASGRRATIDISDDTGIPPMIDLRFVYGRIIIENEAVPWRLMHRTRDEQSLPLTRYGTPLAEKDFPNFKLFGIIEMAESAIQDAFSDGDIVSGMPEGLDTIRLFAAIRYAMRIDDVVRFPLPPTVENEEFLIP